MTHRRFITPLAPPVFTRPRPSAEVADRGASSPIELKATRPSGGVAVVEKRAPSRSPTPGRLEPSCQGGKSFLRKIELTRHRSGAGADRENNAGTRVRLTPHYRPMRRSLSTLVRLSAGGDWIRTSSTRAREVGCRAPKNRAGRIAAAQLADLVLVRCRSAGTLALASGEMPWCSTAVRSRWIR